MRSLLLSALMLVLGVLIGGTLKPPIEASPSEPISIIITATSKATLRPQATKLPTVRPTSTPPPTATPQPNYGQIILKTIRTEAKLQTITMLVAADITLKREGDIPGCGQEITYLGYTTIKAGVDLAAINEKSVVWHTDTVTGKPRVTITVPKPIISGEELDTAKSRVIHQNGPNIGCASKTDVLVQEAQRAVIAKALSAALNNDILPQAQERADFAIRRLLLSVGIDDVHVEFR